MKPIPFIDLAAQQNLIADRVMQRIKKVLTHGNYIMGPEVAELESKLAEFAGSRHAISCSSGTDALLMALMAYQVGPGDAIFTTPFTFIATAEVIALLGATPVFVDIDPRTFNIDPDRLEVAFEAVIAGEPAGHPLPKPCGMKPDASRTVLTPRGIIGVDLFGLPAEYDRINAFAAKNQLFVIEDAAQSFGALYRGRRAPALSGIGATSFFPAKPLGCYGDGGAIFTDNDELAACIKSIRIHGKGSDKYDNVRIGLNGRLDTLQAAILLEKLEIFPAELEARNEVARLYSQNLKGSVNVPWIPENSMSAWAQYSVTSPNRALIQAGLKAAGIPTQVYYPKPLHLQTAFSHLGYAKGDFKVSEMAAETIFSLPMHPYLEEAQVKTIAGLIKASAE